MLSNVIDPFKTIILVVEHPICFANLQRVLNFCRTGTFCVRAASIIKVSRLLSLAQVANVHPDAEGRDRHDAARRPSTIKSALMYYTCPIRNNCVVFPRNTDRKVRGGAMLHGRTRGARNSRNLCHPLVAHMLSRTQHRVSSSGPDIWVFGKTRLPTYYM